MYGDTEVMRRRVDQLREQGTDIRTLADQLVARTEALGWSGRAAESLRIRIRDRAAQLRYAAGRHDSAADSLERHLGEIDRLKDVIATTERKVAALVADREPADRRLADFEPPPPAHKDWLSVAVPGL